MSGPENVPTEEEARMSRIPHIVGFLTVAAVLAAGLTGCNAPRVERAAEVQRFQNTLQERTKELKLVPGAVLSVKDCEEIALQNNLSLAVQRLALRLSDDQVRLAFSGALPHLSAGYNFSRRSNSSAISFAGQEVEMQDRTQQGASISATIPILDYGISFYAWQNAKDQRTQQTLLLVRAGQELRRDVRIAYARHASALRQVRLSTINVQAAERIVQVGESMEKQALATHAEVAVVRAALAQTRADLTVALRKVEETRLSLILLLSLAPETSVVIDEKLPELPAPPTVAEIAALEEHALLVRPELRVQDLQRHISANTARQALAAFFPRIDANGSFNWTNASNVVNPTFFLYGFSVASALLDGTAQVWRYGLTEKTQTVEEERTLLLSLGILYDVNLRAMRLQRDRETIGALEAQEAARQKAFDEIYSLYKAGLETEAGTAKALADLNQQSLGVDRAQTDYLVNWYEFQDATLADVPVSAGGGATQPTATTQPVGATGPEKGK
jgi:outer membrane protein TolC